MATPESFGSWQKTDADIAKAIKGLQGEGVKRIRWMGKKSCDHCIINDGLERNLGTSFPNGCLIPPAHPNCQCTIERIGTMSVSTKPWDGSASRWPDAASYCKACLIHRPHTGPLTKDDCSLPIKEPGGAVNANALSAAAAALAGARGGLKGVSPAERKSAARALIRAYGSAGKPAPDSLKRMAAS